MRIKKRFPKLVLAFSMLMTIVPSNIMPTKAATTEAVITEIDNVNVGTEMNQFEFTGVWVSDTNPAAKNGTEHWTNKGKWGDALPSVTLRFKGNKVELFGQKEATGAIYRAVLDGDEEKAVTIDTYNLSKQPQERIYVMDGLEEKEHTLTLQVLKEINVLGGTYENVNVSAVIDYALVHSMEEVDVDKDIQTYINDHDMGEGMFQFQYVGEWGASTGYPDAFYKGDEHWKAGAKETEPYFILNFYGSKIELYGVKEASAGYYDISIDNGEFERVNPYSPNRLTKQKFYEKDGLAEGEHTLKLIARHEKAPESTGYSAEIDYAIATHKLIPATGVAFTTDGVQIEAGMSTQVQAVATPSYASNVNINYAIEDEAYATITEDGLIHAIQEGTTNVIASIENTSFQAKMPLTVLPQGAPFVASVGDVNLMKTQDDYEEVLKQNTNSYYDVAWIGDVLNSKIDLATKRAIHDAEISASDFKSEDGTISSSNIEIKWLKDTMANIGRGNSGAPVKPFPDVIHQGGKLDIEQGKVQSSWININVPKDAAPGIYKGSIRIDAQELDQPITFEYIFEVLDLIQPDPKEMSTQVQLWQHPFSVANYYGVDPADYFDEPHLKYMRESMKEYASLGGKDVVANIVDEAWGHQSYYSDPTMVTWIKKADGTMAFDYDWFDKWIQFNIDSGVLDPLQGIGQIKCFSIVPWKDSFTYFDEASQKTVVVDSQAGSDYWKEMWTAFLTDFMGHVEDKGWFDITYISLDERPMNRVGPAVELIESVENKEGKHFKISSAFNYESGDDYSFLDRIDDISIGLSHVNDNSQDMQNLSKHRQELGLLTTIYTCTGDYPGNFTISDPADNAWGVWYTMKQNTDGYMKWAWDNWVPDPLSDVTYKYWEPGDGWFIYPTEKGQENATYFYKTPRYELLKQGVRDINKAKYLMEHSTTLAPKVDALVKSLVRPKAGGNGYGSAVPATPEDRLIPGTEVARMRKGIEEFAREYIKEHHIAVTAIHASDKDITLTEGETATVTATVLPDNASNKQVRWKSENETIATVVDGTITANKAGTTTILVSAENGTVSETINITVEKAYVPVSSIEVDSIRITLEEGQQVIINAQAKPDDAMNKALTWKSKNEKIAIVDSGTLTAISAGKTTVLISAEDGKVTKEISVEVVKKADESDLREISNHDQSISVIGNFASDVVFITQKLTGAEFQELVDLAIAKNKEFFMQYKIEEIFDLALRQGDQFIQPDSKVLVKLKISEELKTKVLSVIRIHEDGTVEMMPFEIEDGYIVFTTTHFSKYAIVSKQKTSNEQISPSNSPKTGDTTSSSLWMLLAFMSYGIFYVLGKKEIEEK